jgi:hypothetical protein
MFPYTRVSVDSLFVDLALPNLELRLRSFVLRVHNFVISNLVNFGLTNHVSHVYPIHFYFQTKI